MGDFIILALALNFFWLPSLVIFILDSLSVIGGDEAHCSKIMQQYGTAVIPCALNYLDGFLFSWVGLPLHFY